MLWRVLVVMLVIFVGLILLVGLVLWRLYASFRGMCRGVRAELRTALQREHPEIEVVREWQGNIVVKTPERGEFVWELSDVYTAVGRLPGMGRDPAGRAAVYRDALRALVAGGETSEPTTPEAWRERVRPRLVPPAGLDRLGSDVARMPIPELGLTTVYVLDHAGTDRYITEPERVAHGLDPDGLHRLAIDNLKATLPPKLLNDPLCGRAASGVQSGDTFDAARLLAIPELLEEGQSLVAVIRHSDLLLLLPASVGEDPAKMSEALAILTDHGHPPLLDRAVRVTRGGFALL